MITVLKFSAPWCAPCKAMSQIFKDVDGITNIDVDEDTVTATRYGIRRIPTFVFLKDDKEVYRTSGPITMQQYESILIEINDAKELNDIEVVDAKIETGEK
jgi:thioredoxin 1